MTTAFDTDDAAHRRAALRQREAIVAAAAEIEALRLPAAAAKALTVRKLLGE